MTDSSAKNTSQGCSTVIKGIWFDLGCLGPALVIILILAFLKRRVKFKLQNCSGYPGLLVPFNFLGGFSNRYTIAVTFGATASTCLRMFLNPKYGIFQMPDPAGWVQDRLTHFSFPTASGATIFALIARGSCTGSASHLLIKA